MATFVRPWCKHFGSNNMPDGHVCDAPFVLIGEAPGRREDETGRPFVGPSGYDLETWWKGVGLNRSMFYIDNCFPYKPPENKIDAVPRELLEKGVSAMLSRIRRQTNAKVVVPTGNTALRALFSDAKMAISDWRGSILLWEGRKCIPTIHPAATQRQKILTKLCVADWKRIAEEGQTKEYSIPQRKHLVDPSPGELTEFDGKMERYFRSATCAESTPPPVLSVDVENQHRTWPFELECVGFSFDPLLSITVPSQRRFFESEELYQEAQRYVRKWLRAYPVVGQNYQTDLWKLGHRWPELWFFLKSNYHWDLMEMAHLLDPNDGGDTSEGSENETDEGLRIGMNDLATLTSLYTKQPYYKWMNASWDQGKRWVYNGLDACVQREIFDVLWRRLREKNLV